MTFGSILCGMGGENKFMYTTTDQTFLHLLCFQLVFSYAVHSVLIESDIANISGDGYSMQYNNKW